MAYGQHGDLDQLTRRNQQRVNILKFLAQHPEGANATTITHEVIKGVNPEDYSGHPDLSGKALKNGDLCRPSAYNGNTWVALDGSDDDYQFVNRFINELIERTDLVTVAQESPRRHVVPTLSLVDLISSSITQTPSVPNEICYDREFCRKTLKANRSRLKKLSNEQKKLLAKSLRDYILDIEDYRLVFDVTLDGFRGQEERRTTKQFATRFNSEKRVNRAFARLQDSLAYGYNNAENAVFCTLTTDPKQFDSLYEAIIQINKNWNRLNSWLQRDPSTAEDTKQEDVPQWTTDLDPGNQPPFQGGGVTGRPREKLDYVKVLEFTEAGYPHLHVLFFDVPTREKDGMPWLCDKKELSYHWKQGDIVDVYPLVYRDDLDDLPAEFNAQEGFVNWYRYGDHTHDDRWVENQIQKHKTDGQIDFDGHADNQYEKTAGSYIGKYISETYQTLHDFEDTPLEEITDVENNQFWKLGLYWFTNRRFWSPSRSIEKAMDRTPTEYDQEVQQAVKHCTRTTLEVCTETHHVPHTLLAATTLRFTHSPRLSGAI